MPEEVNQPQGRGGGGGISFLRSQACQSGVGRGCRVFLFGFRSAADSWAVPSPGLRAAQHTAPLSMMLSPSQLLPFRVSVILALPGMHSRCEEQPLPGISHPFPLLDCLSNSDNTSSITLHQLENPLISLNFSHSSSLGLTIRITTKGSWAVLGNTSLAGSTPCSTRFEDMATPLFQDFSNTPVPITAPSQGRMEKLLERHHSRDLGRLGCWNCYSETPLGLPCGGLADKPTQVFF